MNKFVLLLLIFTLSSCGLHSNGIDVLVKNNTEKNIENARFRALYSELQIGEISPGAKFKGYLDMSEEPRIDGGYLLIFENKIGEEIRVGAGYYTLGRPLDRRITFAIENDTIIVNFSNFGRSFKGEWSLVNYPTWKAQWNGIGDAYRHTLWNALGARRLGESKMEELATAHEDIPPDYEYRYKEHEMDLYNNEVGRNLSTGSGKMWQVVKSSLETGELRYLHPRGIIINGINFPYLANEQSVLIPTNQ